MSDGLELVTTESARSRNATDHGREHVPARLLLGLIWVSTAVVFVASAGTPFSLAVGCVVAVLAVSMHATSLLMFVLGLSTLTNLGPLADGSTVPGGLVLLTAVLVASSVRALQSGSAAMPRMGLAAVGLMVVGAATLRLPSTPAGMIPAYSMAFLPLAMFLVISVLGSARRTGSLLAAYVLGTVVVGLRELVEISSILRSDYGAYLVGRTFESLMGSSNYTAGLAAAIGVACVSLGLSSRRFIGFAVIGVPFLVAPVVLLSRGAIISTSVGLGLVVGLRVSGRGRRLGVLLVATLVALAFTTRWTPLLERFAHSDDFSSGRTPLWRATWEALKGSPVLGVGPGVVNEQLYEFYGSAYSHNLLLQTFAALGLVLGAVYLWVIRPAPLTASSAATPAIACLVVHSLVEPMVDTVAGAGMYAFLAAIHWHLAAKPGGGQPAAPGDRPCTQGLPPQARRTPVSRAEFGPHA